MFEFVKDYKENDALRASFNRLAEKTFGLNFEDWYQNGFWQDKYIPYSMIKDGEVVANVSVNIMNMRWDGKLKHLIQLGTVMTEEQYRNQGLIRRLMEEIEDDYEDKADGMYLFANDSVLEFYPRFGFEKTEEYQYSREVMIDRTVTVEPIPMKTKEDWKVLENVIKNNQFRGQFDMADNPGLYMFYVSKFMQENVYYNAESETYVIAEVEEKELLIHAVFSERDILLEDVIASFGSEIEKVILGFTPKEREGYDCRKICEEDTTLFVKGKIFDDFEKKRMMFPTLSHA